MERPRRPILTFEAGAERSDGSVAPFSLRVFEPEYDEGRGHFCLVECPFLEQGPFRIFGEDQAQACELSIYFIHRMIEGDVLRLVDTQGQEIRIPEISWSPPG
jgi:hypothetical protein